MQEKIKRLKDSMAARLQYEPKPPAIDLERNMKYILEIQKEQKAKKLRSAYIRIAIGVFLLILLFVGLRYRGKKRTINHQE